MNYITCNYAEECLKHMTTCEFVCQHIRRRLLCVGSQTLTFNMPAYMLKRSVCVSVRRPARLGAGGPLRELARLDGIGRSREASTGGSARSPYRGVATESCLKRLLGSTGQCPWSDSPRIRVVPRTTHRCPQNPQRCRTEGLRRCGNHCGCVVRLR